MKSVIGIFAFSFLAAASSYAVSDSSVDSSIAEDSAVSADSKAATTEVKAKDTKAAAVKADAREEKAASAESESQPLAIAEKISNEAIANKKESEIPLNLDQKKSAANDGGGPFRILFSMSVLGLLATGAFYVVKKYGRPKSQFSQTQIKVLTQHHLGPKKSLAIIRVAGESILIGVTDQNINMIKSLSLMDEEVPEEVPAQFGLSFGKVFSKENREFTPSAPDMVFETSAAEQIAEKTPAAKISFANRSASGSDKAGKGKTNFANNSEDEFSFGGIKDVVSKKLKGMRNLDI